MFTGIIEEIGIINEIKTGSGFSEINIRCSTVLENTKLGDSIAVNGVCLTVKEFGDKFFKADIMGETLDKSNLGSIKNGDSVNLERALMLGDRLGGHMVSGHIDGSGRIVAIESKDDGTWFSITADDEILNHIVYKGSITIDGISLTVAYVDNEIFKVSVIPHTLENTILKNKENNFKVNLECDMIGKYVEKLLGFKNEKESSKAKESKITMEFLMENGF